VQENKPGVEANGLVLGEDGQWHPVVPVAPTGYRHRYASRWRMCFLIFAVIGALFAIRLDATSGHHSTVGFAVDVLVGAAVEGVFFGSLVCLVAAAFPSRRSPEA
jgi:hypothetical protein